MADNTHAQEVANRILHRKKTQDISDKLTTGSTGGMNGVNYIYPVSNAPESMLIVYDKPYTQEQLAAMMRTIQKKPQITQLGAVFYADKKNYFVDGKEKVAHAVKDCKDPQVTEFFEQDKEKKIIHLTPTEQYWLGKQKKLAYFDPETQKITVYKCSPVEYAKEKVYGRSSPTLTFPDVVILHSPRILDDKHSLEIKKSGITIKKD